MTLSKQARTFNNFQTHLANIETVVILDDS